MRKLTFQRCALVGAHETENLADELHDRTGAHCLAFQDAARQAEYQREMLVYIGEARSVSPARAEQHVVESTVRAIYPLLLTCIADSTCIKLLCRKNEMAYAEPRS